jgi:hypothetical protein
VPPHAPPVRLHDAGDGIGGKRYKRAMTQHDDPGESERDRRTTNVFLLVMFAVVAGGGIWLAKAMVDARKADECIALGRRNCAPIDVPPR